MEIQGWYYLHTNGSLIYKPSAEAAADIRDSDFARAMWPVNVADRAGAWRLLVEALSLGADKKRISELSEKWKCTDEDAGNYADYLGLNLYMDGNAWCATLADHIDLQVSPSGFGDTALEAFAALCRDLGYTGGKMWNTTFHDLCGRQAERQPLPPAPEPEKKG